MKYSDLVALLSEARMSKYNRVTHGDKVYVKKGSEE